MLKDHAMEFYDLLDALSSAISPSATVSATISASTFPMTAPAAMITSAVSTEGALGCNLFSNFTSLCASATHTSASIEPTPTFAALSSCVCYSATHNFGGALAIAALTCGANTTAYTSASPSLAFSAVATSATPSSGGFGMAMSANRMERRCAHMGEVRNLASVQLAKVSPSATSFSDATATESSDGVALAKSKAGLSVAGFAGVLLI